ncbi:cytochrome P450 family protein [Phytohabitans aurantiacus]|uniref:Cytochrome P450 n=1 Tax=Phytohabitans aurantiacus TaxID=3016789 RepID=A0ABQ5QRE4_9ACTN|nr:cytochrome P450 [Phytohabitans aurantiacus]GLH96547.1 cytochrome P450 [Phytohabitans aurantiacus]
MDIQYELSADFTQWPDGFLDRLRERGPIHRVRLLPDDDVWLVTSYQDVRAALSEPGLSSDDRYVNGTGEGDQLGGSMLTADPPDHTRLRRLVSAAFTPRRVEGLRPAIARIAGELLDSIAPLGSTDLMASYALPLPTRVICALLGVPDEDRDQVRAWSDALFVAPVDAAAVADVLAARSALRGYLAELLAAKRREPGDDLLSALCAKRDPLTDGAVLTDDALLTHDAVLTDDELVATGVLLLVAGHETTAGLIAAATLRLLTHPDLLARVREDRALLAPALEESLRMDGAVVLGVVRYTKRDVTIAGVRIPAGEAVMLCTPAANRDPARFAHPDIADLARPENPHLSFGHGIHFCLGAPLARLEAGIALDALLDRLPDLALAVPPAEIRWRSSAVRRLAALPVRFTPSS